MKRGNVLPASQFNAAFHKMLLFENRACLPYYGNLSPSQISNLQLHALDGRQMKSKRAWAEHEIKNKTDEADPGGGGSCY